MSFSSQHAASAGLAYAAAVACMLALAAMTGCSQVLRDRVLHFFFEIPTETATVTTPKSPTTQPDHPPAGVETASLGAPERSQHKPFVMRECYKCHVRADEQALRDDFVDACRDCHPEYFEYRRYGHGPVAAGQCDQCHVQHRSAYTALLSGPEQTVCAACHDPDAMAAVPDHAGTEAVACTACHDAHFGTDPGLLKPEQVREEVRRRLPATSAAAEVTRLNGKEGRGEGSIGPGKHGSNHVPVSAPF